MLCPKCHTAIADNQPACISCGEKNPKEYNLKISLAAIVALVFTFGVIIFAYKNNFLSVANAEGVADTKIDVVVNIDESTGEEELQQEISSPSPDLSDEMPLEEVSKMLDNIKLAAYEYLHDYGRYSTLISRNGYFFDYTANKYIQVADLLDITNLDVAYANENALLLYLLPSDLEAYGLVTVGVGLQLFAAYETKDGFMLTSMESQGGILPRENLKELLDKYIYQHGETARIFSANESYRDITSEIFSSYGDTDYDIRYLAADEKYAIAVVSHKSSSESLLQCVLKKNGDKWHAAQINL